MTKGARVRVEGGNKGAESGRRRAAAWLRGGTILALGVAISGCSKKDQKKCQQALDVARQSLKVQNVDLAHQWRDRAYTYCADASELQKLDQDLVAGQNAIESDRRQKEAKQTHAQELTALLVQWAGDHRAQPAAAAADVTCGPPDADAGTKPAAAGKPGDDKQPRWCTRKRTVSGGFQLAVRYREDDTKVVDFSTLSPAPVDCSALGANKVMIQGPPKTYCEITGGRLQGMQALITNQPDGTHVDVFTPEYVQRDATIRALTR